MNPNYLKLEQSPISKIIAKTAQQKSQGMDVIDAGVGEFYLRTNKNIVNYSIQAFSSKEHGYTNVSGISDLLDSIKNKITRDYFIECYDSSEIIATTGAKHAIYNVMSALINKGDKVLIFAPYWPSYIEMIKVVGGLPIILDTSKNHDFVIDLMELDKLLKKHTISLAIVNSPSNPSGYVIGDSDRKSIVNSILQHSPAYIMFDDVYQKINWSTVQNDPIGDWFPSDSYHKLIIVNSLSKSCSMTGWRVGYVHSKNKKLIQVLRNIQSQSISNVSTISQHAAVEALRHEDSYANEVSSILKVNALILSDAIHSTELFSLNKTEAGFFAFPSVSRCLDKMGQKSDIELAERLLSEYGLATIPGTAFGSPGYLRISFGIEKQEVLRISQILKSI